VKQMEDTTEETQVVNREMQSRAKERVDQITKSRHLALPCLQAGQSTNTSISVCVGKEDSRADLVLKGQTVRVTMCLNCSNKCVQTQNGFVVSVVSAIFGSVSLWAHRLVPIYQDGSDDPLGADTDRDVIEERLAAETQRQRERQRESGSSSKREGEELHSRNEGDNTGSVQAKSSDQIHRQFGQQQFLRI
jgi:hypothetical protein